MVVTLQHNSYIASILLIVSRKEWVTLTSVTNLLPNLYWYLFRYCILSVKVFWCPYATQRLSSSYFFCFFSLPGTWGKKISRSPWYSGRSWVKSHRNRFPSFLREEIDDADFLFILATTFTKKKILGELGNYTNQSTTHLPKCTRSACDTWAIARQISLFSVSARLEPPMCRSRGWAHCWWVGWTPPPKRRCFLKEEKERGSNCARLHVKPMLLSQTFSQREAGRYIA